MAKYVHADSTLVPANAYKGGYDVRDREMTRIFNAVLDKGIHLTVIFDSCHSGGISRGIGPRYRARTLAYDPRDIAEAPDTLADGQPQPAPTERKDNPALVFSAAQQDQAAQEMPLTDKVTEPHGAFTAALIEALLALPADSPASIVYQRVKAVLEGSGISGQEPDLDAETARRQEPLFGGTAANTGKARAAALQTDEDGNVWMDIGRASSVGVGSEFTSMVLDGRGQSVKLRVTELEGIARSSTTVIGPSGAKVAPGDIFELTKWIPAESVPLHVWNWPANLVMTRFLPSYRRSAPQELLSSPIQPRNRGHTSSAGRHNWTLEQAGSHSPTAVGTQLTTDALKKHLPASARLWVNLPPPRELTAKLLPADGNSAVQKSPDLARADYALTGTLTSDGPAYAWFHKSELSAGPPASIPADHSPGCSSTSQYPVRSGWVVVTDASGLDEGGKALNKSAGLLAKVHGWLELAESPADASTADYYTLAMVHASDESPITAEQPARQGEVLKMALRSKDRVIEKRWVYILDIDLPWQGLTALSA